jgi:hypothetical protein
MLATVTTLVLLALADPPQRKEPPTKEGPSVVKIGSVNMPG